MANSNTSCVSGDCVRVFLTYEPSLAGSAVFLALFAILIPIAVALGIRYRSSTFGTTVATGVALEVVGYIGRLLLHSTPNNQSDFAVFLIGTILGPTCICGAMFLVVPRIVAVYGEEYRSWRPTWYSVLFGILTAIIFVLELAGGVLSTVRSEQSQINTGVQLLSAGLAIQLVALLIFVFHGVFFMIALKTRSHGLDPKFAAVYNSKLFAISVTLFVLATAALILRTAYRTVEIAEGYGSSIAQNEVLFLVLDGLFVLLATLLILIGFPARALGAAWSQSSPRRSSQRPPRPVRPPTTLASSARTSPTYNRMSMKSHVSNPSPRKASYPRPPPMPQPRGLVDSDALW
ncbi:hypothetical protein F5Y16DRAFT_200209 [Xylariaceae sp. FL0255]|nr:hypothetical protein F5Y16DRAFT_200209 [Xylariaceae sp. FL0255]